MQFHNPSNVLLWAYRLSLWNYWSEWNYIILLSFQIRQFEFRFQSQCRHSDLSHHDIANNWFWWWGKHRVKRILDLRGKCYRLLGSVGFLIDHRGRNNTEKQEMPRGSPAAFSLLHQYKVVGYFSSLKNPTIRFLRILQGTIWPFHVISHDHIFLDFSFFN